MIDYRRTILNSRINTILGTLLLGSWTLGWCLLMWHAASDQNPVASVFASVLPPEIEY